MSPSIATAAAPAVPRRALPTNESVSAQHPDLPGLAAVLDPERRAEVLAPIVGDPPMEVARLRLKPGTSVALALRPATGARRDLNAGRPHGWWRVLAFAPEPFAPKADKERIAAERTHLPILVDRELRLVVSPAETDRALRGLAWLRPDSGCLVSVEGRPRTVHTLSYNPDRRWVGMARDPLGRERSVLRMYADDGTLHVEPWADGRAWSAGDSPDLLPALGAALAAGLHRRFGADRGAAVRGFDLAQLDQAARFLAGLDQEWGERADAVARSIAPRLGGLDLAPAHGDLSPTRWWWTTTARCTCSTGTVPASGPPVGTPPPGAPDRPSSCPAAPADRSRRHCPATPRRTRPCAPPPLCCTRRTRSAGSSPTGLRTSSAC